MDEAIWFWAGMISVIIGLVVLSRVAMNAAEQNTQNTIETALSQLKTQCDFICNQERGTRLGVRVSVPLGSVLTTFDELICMEHERYRGCVACGCELTRTTALNLTAPEARYFPPSHIYECRFHNIPPVAVTCLG